MDFQLVLILFILVLLSDLEPFRLVEIDLFDLIGLFVLFDFVECSLYDLSDLF